VRGRQRRRSETFIDTHDRALSRALVPIGLLAVIWGLNWPILKIGVTEMAPLTFRALTLPFAALCMLAYAKWSGESLRVPPGWWPRVLVLAALAITGWNGLVLFGVRELASGRSAILAYTMPIFATAIALVLLKEPMSPRKIVGFVLGMSGMGLLLGDDVRHLARAPHGAYLILGAALVWALGTVLLRKWQPPIAQSALSGWMMLLGWIPLALAAPFVDDAGLAQFAHLSGRAWFSIAYNIFLAGTVANLTWFTLARTLPVAVSSMASLPIPVVGVFSGMLVLGERPGVAEWLALALVIAALGAVLLPSRSDIRTAPMPIEPD
jgi:drug/metabolite transporter (DMT)-like permease